MRWNGFAPSAYDDEPDTAFPRCYSELVEESSENAKIRDSSTTPVASFRMTGCGEKRRGEEQTI